MSDNCEHIWLAEDMNSGAAHWSCGACGEQLDVEAWEVIFDRNEAAVLRTALENMSKDYMREHCDNCTTGGCNSKQMELCPSDNVTAYIEEARALCAAQKGDPCD